jgi:hypothetical protein
MSAWGCGFFENDDALDWLSTITEGDDVSIISNVLNSALTTDEFLELHISDEVLADAASIRSMTKGEISDLPKEYSTWIGSRDRST